jgi:uncharacterized protein
MQNRSAPPMRTQKDKAINLILLGMAIQFIPLILGGVLLNIFAKSLKYLPKSAPALVGLCILSTFLIGYIFLIKGCRLYIQSKGYSPKWGWLGLLSLLGSSILMLIPSRISTTPLAEEDSVDQPFKHFNIIELLVVILKV